MSELDIHTRIDFSGAMSVFQAMTARKDLTPWFKQYLTPTLITWIKYQYASKGSALGTPWKPIRGSTSKIREGRRGGSIYGYTYPMVDTGRSMRALTTRTGPDAIRQYSPYTMTFGASVPYLAYHHRPGGYNVTYVYGKRIKAGPTHVDPRYVLPPNWPTQVTSPWEKSLLGYIKYITTGTHWTITSNPSGPV